MTARYLFGRSRTLPRSVITRLRSCRQIILLLDFDGTLAPIRPTPAQARMPARTRALLQLLARHPSITVGIVTGRSLPDIRKKIGRQHLLLIANHGFEIFLDGVCWTHPWAKRSMPLLQRLARKLKGHLKTIPGVLVEQKRYSLTIHYRAVRRNQIRTMQEVALDILSPFWRDIRITKGKKVLEVRPNVPWGKGTAIQRVLTLLNRQKDGCVIYAGDDTTDEDAFAALRGGGVTVAVGKKKQTHAAYWVRDPGEVWEFLAALAITMAERTKP